MFFKNFTKWKFIRYMVKYTRKELLDKCEGASEKGIVIQAIWDILTKPGFLQDIFPRSKYVHMTGNMNNGILKKLVDVQAWLDQNINDGNSGGSSDITLYNKDDKTYTFISIKYHTNPEKKHVDNFDIDKLGHIISKNKRYTDSQIYLFVRDREAVLKIAKDARKSSKRITNYMTPDHILDDTDLDRYYRSFVEQVQNIDRSEFEEKFFTAKDSLQFRFHQKLTIQKTMHLITGKNKELYILWEHKCRSGKTYMAGGIIISVYEHKKDLDPDSFIVVLIITPAPNETISQFTEELFAKFQDFHDFKVVHLNGKNCDNLKIKSNTIFIASKQFLEKKIIDKNNNNNIIKSLQKCKLDLIIVDESHHGGSTAISKNIINTYGTENHTVHIFMTATFQKPRFEWQIPKHCELTWDLDDETYCKKLDAIALIERHGPVARKLLSNQSDIEYYLDSYATMPKLVMLTSMIDHEIYKNLQKNINKSTPYCFSSNVLLELTPDKKQLVNQVQLQKYLSYFSGCNELKDFPDKNKSNSIMGRVSETTIIYKSRTPFTWLMFLPPDNINETSTLLRETMLKDSVLKKYSIVCINSKLKISKHVKDYIENCKDDAERRGKTGLIILAGSMLSLGITISHCDVVVLMHDSKSSDKIYQQMFRCMTEAPGKTCGIVVDLNISRVLQTCITCGTKKLSHKDKQEDNVNNLDSRNTEEQFKDLTKNQIIDIDPDVFNSRNRNTGELVQSMLEYWREEGVHTVNSLLKKISDDPIILSIKDDKKMQKLLKFSKSKVKVIVTADNDQDQILPKGKKVTRRSNNSNIESDSDSSDSSSELSNGKIMIERDLLPVVVPFLCILTIRCEESDISKMITLVLDNPKLLKIFDDQSVIWWGKAGLGKFIKKIADKYIKCGGSANNVSLRIRMELKSLIDKTEKLYKFIAECLLPKDSEKKEFSEVFTPMEWVNKMLDDLPKEVWHNPKLKWYDPANGMGFLILDNSL